MINLYRGDDTDAFGGVFLTIRINNPYGIGISKAVLQIGDYSKTFLNPEDVIRVKLNSCETRELRSTNVCNLAVWDNYTEDGVLKPRKRTCKVIKPLIINTERELVDG